MSRIGADNVVGQTDVAKTPNAAVSVGTSSTQIVAAFDGRVEINICNDSANTVYLSLGGAAVSGQGIRLNANGGSYSSGAFTGAIFGIAAVSSNVTVAEV